MKKICKVILAAAAVVALAVPAMAAVGDKKLIVKDDVGTAEVFTVDNTGSIKAGIFSVDNVAKRLGSGLSAGHTAEASLHVVDIAASANRGMIVGQHNAGGQAANVQFRKSRGSDLNNNSYAIVNYQDFVGAFHGYGWDGTQWVNGATINFQVDTAVPGVNKVGMNMIFATGETGSTGTGNIVKVPRLYISSAGKIGMGEGFAVTTPPVVSGTGVLHIKGDAIRLESSRTPTQGSTCNVGEIVWDAGYVYVCTAANTWKRATLAAY